MPALDLPYQYDLGTGGYAGGEATALADPSSQFFLENKRRQAQADALTQAQLEQHQMTLAHERAQNEQDQDKQTAQTMAGDIAESVNNPNVAGKPWSQIDPYYRGSFSERYGAASIDAPAMWNQAQREATGHADIGFENLPEGAATTVPMSGGHVTVGSGKERGVLEKQARDNGLDPTGLSNQELNASIAKVKQAKLSPPPVSYDDLHDDLRNIVDRIGSYQMPFPSMRGGMPPAQRAQIIAALAEKYPEYDAKEYQSRQSALTGFKSGIQARNITSANTVVGHLQTLNDAVKDLNNGRFTYGNTFKNWLNSTSGAPAVTKFNIARDAVASELAALFKGTGAAATDQEIKEWRNSISPNMSPEQLHEGIRQATGLMGSRLDALQEQWEKGVKSERTTPFLSPRSRAILRTMGVKPESVEAIGQPSAQTETQNSLEYNEALKWLNDPKNKADPHRPGVEARLRAAGVIQ